MSETVSTKYVEGQSVLVLYKTAQEGPYSWHGGIYAFPDGFSSGHYVWIDADQNSNSRRALFRDSDVKPR